MKTIFRTSLTIIFLISFAFILENCKKDSDPSPQPPEITSFTPTSGMAGTPVVITGKNFSTVLSENAVSFNGTPATVVTATSIALAVTIPSGATTGKITVTVKGNTATSTDDFTIILPPPTITTIAPVHALPGASVTITGTNFIAGNVALNAVKFNGTQATVTAATATQLTVTIPVGATTGKINVNVAGQSVSSANDYEVLIDIPRDGLVAFYPFSGNANDISGNSLNGTANGNATLDTDRYGNSNDAYTLDGTNSYINMGNPAGLQISTSITVAGWFNVKAFNVPASPGSKSMAIVTKIYFDPSAGGNPRKGYVFSQDFYGGGTPAVSMAVYSSSGGSITTFNSAYVTASGDPLTTNTWVFIAMVIDGANIKFYKNGVKTYDQNGSGTALDDGSLGEFNIGRYGGGFYFNGKVDDFAVYNKALDATAVSQLYNQTITKYP